MAKDKNEIVDRLFESRLKDAKLAPPAGLWDSISSDLENDQLRRKVAMWRWVAAATILLFLGFGSWTLLHFTSVNHQAEGFAIAEQGKVAPASDLEKSSVLASAEIECQEATHLAAAPSNEGVSPNAITLVNHAAKLVRENRLNLVRKAAALPPVELAAMESRSPANLSPRYGPSGISGRDYSQLSLPSLAAATPQPEDEESPRVKRREREIIAWEAGDQGTRDKNQLKWAIGGTFSPDVAFATQIPVSSTGARTTQPTLPDDAANSSRRLSDPVATFSTGIRAAVDLNDRMAVRSGVLYTRRSGTQTELSSSFGKQESYANNFSVDYLEVPISFQYNLVKGKVFDYYVSSGVAGNLMLGYQQELQTSNGKIASKKVSDKGQAFTPAQASLLLSTGMQYKAFERLSINLEPGLRYGFLTSEYAFSREDPVSFSLMSSLNFHF